VFEKQGKIGNEPDNPTISCFLFFISFLFHLLWTNSNAD